MPRRELHLSQIDQSSLPARIADGTELRRETQEQVHGQAQKLGYEKELETLVRKAERYAQETNSYASTDEE